MQNCLGTQYFSPHLDQTAGALTYRLALVVGTRPRWTLNLAQVSAAPLYLLALVPTSATTTAPDSDSFLLLVVMIFLCT